MKEVKTGLRVTDNVDNENYIITGISGAKITLEHIPKGRRKKLEDWQLVWNEFTSKFIHEELSLEGFTNKTDDEQLLYSVKLITDVISVREELNETKELSEKDQEELARYQRHRSRLETIRIERRKRVNKELAEKKAIRSKITNEVSKHGRYQRLQVLKELSENHPDENVRSEYAIEYEKLNNEIYKS